MTTVKQLHAVPAADSSTACKSMDQITAISASADAAAEDAVEEATYQWLSVMLRNLASQPGGMIRAVRDVLDMTSSREVQRLLDNGGLEQLLQQVNVLASQQHIKPNSQVAQFVKEVCSQWRGAALLCQLKPMLQLLQLLAFSPAIAKGLLLQVAGTAHGLQAMVQQQPMQQLLRIFCTHRSNAAQAAGAVLSVLVKHKTGALALLSSRCAALLRKHISVVLQYDSGSILRDIVQHDECIVALVQQKLLSALSNSTVSITHFRTVWQLERQVKERVAASSDIQAALTIPEELAPLVEKFKDCGWVLTELARTEAGCQALIRGQHVAAIARFVTNAESSVAHTALTILEYIAKTAEGAALIMQHQSVWNTAASDGSYWHYILLSTLAKHQFAAEAMLQQGLLQQVHRQLLHVKDGGHRSALATVVRSLLTLPAAAQEFLRIEQAAGGPWVALLVDSLQEQQMPDVDDSLLPPFAASCTLDALLLHKGGVSAVATAEHLQKILESALRQTGRSWNWAHSVLMKLAEHDSGRHAMQQHIRGRLAAAVAQQTDQRCKQTLKGLLKAIDGVPKRQTPAKQQHDEAADSLQRQQQQQQKAELQQAGKQQDDVQHMAPPLLLQPQQPCVLEQQQQRHPESMQRKEQQTVTDIQPMQTVVHALQPHTTQQQVKQQALTCEQQQQQQEQPVTQFKAEQQDPLMWRQQQDQELQLSPPQPQQLGCLQQVQQQQQQQQREPECVCAVAAAADGKLQAPHHQQDSQRTAAAAGPSGLGPAALALVKREVGAMPSQQQLQYWRLADQPFDAADLQQLVKHYLIPRQGVREKDLRGGRTRRVAVPAGSSIVEQQYNMLAPSLLQLCQQLQQSASAGTAAVAAEGGSKKRSRAADTVTDSGAYDAAAAVVAAAARLSEEPAAAALLRALRCLQLWETRQATQPHMPQMLQCITAQHAGPAAAPAAAAAATATADVEEVVDLTADDDGSGLDDDSEEMQQFLAGQLEFVLVLDTRASHDGGEDGRLAKRIKTEPCSDDE